MNLYRQCLLEKIKGQAVLHRVEFVSLKEAHLGCKLRNGFTIKQVYQTMREDEIARLRSQRAW